MVVSRDRGKRVNDFTTVAGIEIRACRPIACAANSTSAVADALAVLGLISTAIRSAPGTNSRSTILLPAPGRLSMMNGCPSRSDNHCPMSRAVMSAAPAGPNGTIKCTGHVG